MLALLSLSGCRPKGILSSREMREIMYDLHRADGVIYVNQMETGYDETIARYYQCVLDKHGVTQAQFDSSLVWYTDNPALFDKIYPKVMARLEEDVARWEAVQAREQRLRDLMQLPWSRVMPYEMQVLGCYMHDSVPERLGPLNRPTNPEWIVEIKPKMQKIAK